MPEILLYCYRRFGQLTGLHIRLIIPGVHVVSEGSGAPVPDTAELQKRMQELNKEAEPKGWKYLCSGIWHIRDCYFLAWGLKATVDYPVYELDPDLPHLYEIWTDSIC